MDRLERFGVNLSQAPIGGGDQCQLGQLIDLSWQAASELRQVLPCRASAPDLESLDALTLRNIVSLWETLKRTQAERTQAARESGLAVCRQKET